jgi:predicted deacetylase
MTKRVETVKDMTVLLSVHDISPFHEDDIVKTYDLLSDFGISSVTLLVTPFYGLKKINKISENDIFTKFLKSLDLEIAMHGYSHFSKSGSLSEFNGLPQEKVASRLKDGVSILTKGFGLKPSGFISPLWESPPKVVKAVKEVGLGFCVNGNSIHRNSDDTIFTTGERIVSEGQRFLNMETSLIEIELGGSLQIGIHPRDHRTNTLFEVLEDLKDRVGYKFMGYSDYLTSIT